MQIQVELRIVPYESGDLGSTLNRLDESPSDTVIDYVYLSKAFAAVSIYVLLVSAFQIHFRSFWSVPLTSCCFKVSISVS
jgi:hypothetical protein